MSELAPAPAAAVRRRQRLAAVRRREELISILIAEQRLELAALATEDLAGLGTRYVADELAMVWKRSPRQARNRLDLARWFAEFPAVHALVGDGTWLIDHADAVLDELARTGLESEQQQQVLELVLSRSVHRTPWELRQGVRTAAVVLFPEHAAERAERAEADRGVRVHQDAPGVASLYAYGPAPAVAAMFASLDALSFPPAPGDTRGVEQRRFDALQDLVCGRVQPGQWQVQALVGLATLHGEDELAGELVGYGPIPASQARELAAVGALRRVVVQDATGRLVGVDDTVHRPDLAPARVAEQQLAVLPAPRRGTDAEEDPDAVEAGEPDPDAPSAEDRDWHESSQDRDSLYADLNRQRAQLHRQSQKRWPPEHQQDAAQPRGEDPEDSEDPEDPEDPEDAPPSEHAADLAADPTDPPGSPAAARPAFLTSQWSVAGFARALARMRSDPVRPVDLHSDSYAVPARLKRHLVLRDRTCVFPGCPRPALRCDKDHLLPWPRGSTSEPNLADECEHHHQGKHDCLTLQRLPDGTFRWTTPAGITADRPPRPVLDSWLYRPARPATPHAEAEQDEQDEPGEAA